MAEESWHEARLIPTSGINGAEEQERRATSALLAVITAVREFGRGLTQPFGAPAGNIEAFIEVPFMLGEKRCYPDGLIRVTRGQRSWTALVEVKTGTNELATEQLENYLDIAREQGFDALITISNEISPLAGQHPTKVDKRKLRKVDMHHLPWSQILAEAVVQKEHRGVADPDQAWILGELIRYLEHPRSGALEFEDMGSSWVPVRDAIGAGTLRASDKGVTDVAARFDALLRYASLRLGRTLGTEVVPALTRREMAEPALRTTALVESLVRDGRLSGAIRIPHAVAPLNIELDLRANRVTCHVDVDAPREGRPTTRVNWLVRQLKAAPETVRIEAFAMHARGAGATELIKAVREDPAVLVQDPKREIRSFRVALTSPLGTKRGRGRGAAIDSVLEAVEAFYGEVLQNLKTWTAAAPKMREAAELPKEQSSALTSTALSSQDGIEPASAPAEGDRFGREAGGETVASA
ncbi:hypothetical protein [Modestobacter sp. SYSU DS0657]